MSDRGALSEALDAIPRTRILCLGDLMLDRFVYGSVDRISPEAPIPVVRIERESVMLGGAGNVVRNLTALGASVAFLSLLGDDAAGREVMTLVGNEAGVEPYLQVERDRATTIKTRYFAGGQQLLRADNETVHPANPDSIDTLISLATHLIDDCDAVILSDYGKGALTDPLIAAVIAAARRAQKPVVVDPKGRDYSRYRGATSITPNRKEIEGATGITVIDDASAEAAASDLIAQCGVETVLLTRSQDGMSLIGDGPAHHLATEAREVFDVSGAGDTVVAVLAASLAARLALRDAAALANIAAGIVVGKVGTAAVYGDEIATALHHKELRLGEAKLMALDRMADRVERWRRQGLKVGFTNGCFDVLHPGHVSLLRQARAACDRLVVGLNSDSSVRLLKGPERPVQSETARAAVLGSLAAVDGVVVFAEETPLQLIETLRPDVLVKGADYRLDEVVGADVVQGYGGQVLLARLEDGFSTTNTIARMRAGDG